MNISAYISDLLYYNECVIIPGFGGFLTSYKSASIHPSTHTFTPPSKSISFNRRLTNNDGLLINHIAKKEQISYEEADKKIKTYVQEITQSIQHKQMVNFPKIGKLVQDIESNLQFSPEGNINFLLDAFALPAFQSKPVLRKAENEDFDEAHRIKTIPVAEDHTSGRNVFLKTAMALSLIVLFALANLLIFNLYIEDLSLNQSKVFDFLYNGDLPASTNHRDAGKLHHPRGIAFSDISGVKESLNGAGTVNQSSGNPISEAALDNNSGNEVTEITGALASANNVKQPGSLGKSVDNDKKPDAANSARDGYYIVLGSFKDPANAEKMKQKMDETYETTVISRNKWGFDRVGYFVSSRKSEAQGELNYVKGQYPGSWIMYHSADQSAGQ